MFWVALFRPVVMGSDVPIADSHYLGKRPFVAVAGIAEAVTKISGSLSLP